MSMEKDMAAMPDTMDGNGSNNASFQAYDAIVTSKLSESGEVYFQVTESEAVYPANFDLFGYTYDRPRRIVCGLYVYDSWYGNLGRYALIDWMEYVQEGRVVAEKPQGDDDGLDVLDDWMTSLEDGFLTLHYSTWWGTQPRRHELMLILGTNPDDPYEVLLEHRANGDPKAMEADALVTFDINDRLPASQDPGNTPLVTLKWRNDAGETNRRQFSFCRRV